MDKTNRHKKHNGEKPASAPENEPDEETVEAFETDGEPCGDEGSQAAPETPEAETEADGDECESDALAAENERLAAELDDAKDKLLRTAAEYDNYRKRTEREKHDSANFGAINALSKLLPAMDALERASAAECSDAEYKKGVEMTLAMFESALAQAGAEEIEALGAPFDPNEHSAVATDEADGEHESGTVTRVLQKGYKLGERVIRPSVVAVAQ